jgi:hypothetical protein
VIGYQITKKTAQAHLLHPQAGHAGMERPAADRVHQPAGVRGTQPLPRRQAGSLRTRPLERPRRRPRRDPHEPLPRSLLLSVRHQGGGRGLPFPLGTGTQAAGTRARAQAAPPRDGRRPPRSRRHRRGVHGRPRAVRAGPAAGIVTAPPGQDELAVIAVCCSVRCRQARHRFLRVVGYAEYVAPSRPLCLAFTDPPYPGNARLYRDHPDYAGEVDHAELVRRPVTYDGWALSTSAEALPPPRAGAMPAGRARRGPAPRRAADTQRLAAARLGASHLFRRAPDHPCPPDPRGGSIPSCAASPP